MMTLLQRAPLKLEDSGLAAAAVPPNDPVTPRHRPEQNLGGAPATAPE